MDTKLQNGWKYLKEHKKEIAIGAGLVVVSTVAGAMIVHKFEFGSVAARYKLLVGFDKRDAYEAYYNYFGAGTTDVLRGSIRIGILNKEELIESVTKVCKELPTSDNTAYTYAIEAVKKV